MKREELVDALRMDVSRETFERLTRYHDLLLKWSKTHNLIGPRERDEVWRRHILDSLSVWPHVASGSVIMDIGSGAGLPGLVLACQSDADKEFVLVESNAKRCAFLRLVARELDLPVTVENDRVENVSRETLSHITARAVADLSTLIRLSEKWLENSTIGVFLKGRNWKYELTESQRYWIFNMEIVEPESDSDGVILKVSEVRRV
ncbi:MAG: 16S rRNA (guanine(527)-N(7))-methyltransferase RsmG [Ponticaulis sp.]|nr:16S rRNA (guanine(527)-N(7))-methyltransferase RsmG [Ponticaulis sp.]|tara:strand:- start:42261 stop:42875 length:615 start_codon:yes stop_codon:yes gene_type:complete